jgi:CubicO group peptidase (beta-lactamase class C family)
MLLKHPLSVFALAAGCALSAPMIHAADMSEPHSASWTGTLEADLALNTEAGTQLKGPRSWTARRAPQLLVLDAPEGDLHVAIADVAGTDLNGALSAAWSRYQPGFARSVKVIAPYSHSNGWDEGQSVTYESSPNERLFIGAVAFRRGADWSVMLVDGSEAATEKRGAALNLLLRSLSPQGYQRETFAGRTPHAMDAERIAKLRSFLEDGMRLTGVPGVGFAVLDHGKVVYEGGVGVRQLGKPEPVDANTLFMAASNTKGMSTLLLSTLVDEGKLRWDQPVTQVFPSFKLGTDEVTRQVLVKHLVCACTGLPRQDFEWLFEYAHATPESSLKTLATNSPTSGFGEVFQYNNLMAAAAGYIGGHLAYPDLKLGPAYDKAMQVRIFDPLGMSSTTFDMARALRSNHASPHALDVHSKTVLLPMDLNYAVVPHRPAGGVWTSAHDFIRYVQLEANQGKLPDGRQLVSATNLLMRRQPQVAVGDDSFYGMGLEVDSSNGVPVMFHGGSLFGYKSDLFLLPDAGIGAVILTNSDEGRPLLAAFRRRLLELIYDGKEEALDNLRVRMDGMAAERNKEYQTFTLPAAGTRQLAKYYVSKELGDLRVQQRGKNTVFNLGEWQTVVASRKNGDGTISYLTAGAGWAPDPLEFVVGTHDGKRALITRDGQHEYFFIEKK